MKTLFLIIVLLLGICGSHAQVNQITNIDTTTPQVVGGVSIPGDTLLVAFTKANGNFYFLGMLATNATITNSLLVANLNVVSNAFLNFSNLIIPLKFNAVTNFGSNYVLQGSFSGFGTNLTICGTNLVSSTVNSNKFDGNTLTWLQSCDVAGVLMDNSSSTGSSGYYARANGSGFWNWTAWPNQLDYDSSTITSDGGGDIVATSIQSALIDHSAFSGSAGDRPRADGSGNWFWTAPDVIPDTAGNGGTTVHVKASNDGSDMYIHVTSAGVITATTSP